MNLRPALFVASAMVLAAGSVVAYASLVWTIESVYIADITAPDGTSWSLWVPAPQETMILSVTGSAQDHGRIATVRGDLENLTGTGRTLLRYSVHRAVSEADPAMRSWTVNLTGQDNGTRAWVYRQGGGSTQITAAGGTGWTGERLGERIDCGGLGYIADLGQGWNSISLGYGDCAQLLSAIPPAALPVPFFAAGGAAIVVAAMRRPRANP